MNGHQLKPLSIKELEDMQRKLVKPHEEWIGFNEHILMTESGIWSFWHDKDGVFHKEIISRFEIRRDDES